jgi:hypothetical protein
MRWLAAIASVQGLATAPAITAPDAHVPPLPLPYPHPYPSSYPYVVTGPGAYRTDGAGQVYVVPHPLPSAQPRGSSGGRKRVRDGDVAPEPPQ